MSARNLDNVVLFHVAVSLWTGQKKLDNRDIDNDLPKDLGSLGHKKTVDPKTLSPMATVKKAMEIILSNTGIRFMGNFYAVPVNRLKEVSSALDSKVAEGNLIRQDFLANYLTNVEDWILRHPAWADRHTLGGFGGMDQVARHSVEFTGPEEAGQSPRYRAAVVSGRCQGERVAGRGLETRGDRRSQSDRADYQDRELAEGRLQQAARRGR